jgi:hypothetical protein
MTSCQQSPFANDQWFFSSYNTCMSIIYTYLDMFLWLYLQHDAITTCINANLTCDN